LGDEIRPRTAADKPQINKLILRSIDLCWRFSGEP
jgi:hypothetical protein